MPEGSYPNSSPWFNLRLLKYDLYLPFSDSAPSPAAWSICSMRTDSLIWVDELVLLGLSSDRQTLFGAILSADSVG